MIIKELLNLHEAQQPRPSKITQLRDGVFLLPSGTQIIMVPGVEMSFDDQYDDWMENSKFKRFMVAHAGKPVTMFMAYDGGGGDGSIAFANCAKADVKTLATGLQGSLYAADLADSSERSESITELTDMLVRKHKLDAEVVKALLKKVKYANVPVTAETGTGVLLALAQND